MECYKLSVKSQLDIIEKVSERLSTFPKAYVSTKYIFSFIRNIKKACENEVFFDCYFNEVLFSSIIKTISLFIEDSQDAVRKHKFLKDVFSDIRASLKNRRYALNNIMDNNNKTFIDKMFIYNYTLKSLELIRTQLEIDTYMDTIISSGSTIKDKNINLNMVAQRLITNLNVQNKIMCMIESEIDKVE